MDLDDVLQLLGAHGRFQVIAWAIIATANNFPSVMHMNIMTFMGFEPNHHCKIPDNSTLNESIPVELKNGLIEVDKCHRYETFYSNDTTIGSRSLVGCDNGWTYDRDPITSSIVTEWNLVCKDNFLPEMSLTILNVGVMVGAVLFGFLSDKYGRKKVLFGCVAAQAVVGGLLSLSVNIYMFICLRFIIGMLEQGVNITGFIMAMELFPPKERVPFGIIHEVFWAIGAVLLGFYAYLFRDWRHLQLIVSLPVILILPMLWFIPESLVWLISKGRLREAERIIQKAAKWNKVKLPMNILSESKGDTIEMLGKIKEKENIEKERIYTAIDLFRTPVTRRVTICLSFLWLVNIMVYYGLSLNTPNFQGDMYLNYFILQIIEVPALIITYFLIFRIGRRWPLCATHVFGGVACVITPFIPMATSSGIDISWISITMAMLGKFGITASFTILFIYGPEIYPTVIRNTGSGFGSMWGRLGGILYPYIIYFNKVEQLGDFRTYMPMVILGVLSIVAGFLALPLPETNNRPLPETINDLEHYEEFCKMHSKLNNENANI
ncbi:unnamed protein product [Owenia fusiformis]|uniref:Major facilitator superfamily (MFS) profile domain-containing protein n=1 Tax=Owenia fusiformis TaxID=6347 RepID=A0A8S4MZU1_OWEFU|nr:unnamed protein product [Owenia fusiformis]